MNVRKIFLLVLVIFASSVFSDPFSNPRDYEWIVIFDAGTTGSRITGFAFLRDENRKPIQKAQRLIQEKHGLTSFISHPNQCREQVERMIELIKKEFLPEKIWEETQIWFRGTAGLRALPDGQRNILLAEAEIAVRNSKFIIVDQKAVDTLSGEDEGAYSWLAVNYLLGHSNSLHENSVAALDLGGGSVQLTFLPRNYNRINEQVPDMLHTATITEQEKYELYTKSYTGLGLMTGRLDLFRLENDLTKRDANGVIHLVSTCIHPNVQGIEWKYNGNQYSVSGKIGVNSATIFQECTEKVLQVIAKGGIDKTTEVLDRPIFTFNYFYHRACVSKIVNEDLGGGSGTVDSYMNTAKRECEFFTNGKDNPMLCMDLTFIGNLLQNGFGFSGGTSLQIVGNINKNRINWSVGAAYTIKSKQK